MCIINLIGKLAVEERHKWASLWALPSISQTEEAKNLAATVPSPPNTIITPQLQTTPSALNSQPTTVNASALMGSQSPPTSSIRPQPQATPFALNSQPTTVNALALVGPTAMSPQFQTTPSAASTFHDPAMPQSGVAQSPRPVSPMTQFLESTSPLDSFNWAEDMYNGMSKSLNSFDFSGINFSSNPSSDSRPVFGMDQHWNLSGGSIAPINSMSNTTFPSALPMLTMSTTTSADSANIPINSMFNTTFPSALPMSTTTTADANGPVLALNPTTNASINSMSNTTFPSALPMSTTTIADANGPVLALNTTTNMLPSGITDGTDGTTKEDDKFKKRKSYEERNAHCILPEGSRCPRKSRRIEGAENEKTAGPKKRNANVNKKGKGSKGKK